MRPNTIKDSHQSTRKVRGQVMIFALAFVFFLLAGQSSIMAQIPDKFENLKVLPQDITKSKLVSIMKKFTSALGVRCVNCHVGDASKGFSSFEFASDEKELKTKARFMLDMVKQINSELLVNLNTSEREKLEVQCVTCHRGQRRPVLIGDTLMSAYSNGGIDTLVAEFKKLREKYYGSHTFDFGERVLIRIGSQIQALGDMPGAIGVYRLNAEYFPESSQNFAQLAFAHLEMGDTTSAVENLENAVKYSPEVPWFKMQLDKLKGK
ncbi:MAG: c-type cytochrome [candidate division Zixibacteria bacterium]|nr:c-type cytochrome [candidate division Zixibacteria bacterium]